MKWVVKQKDCPISKLTKNQIINHFRYNGALTTKIGLSRSIRHLVWYINRDLDEFFPKCFDLNNVEEYQDFVDEYKVK